MPGKRRSDMVEEAKRLLDEAQASWQNRPRSERLKDLLRALELAGRARAAALSFRIGAELERLGDYRHAWRGLVAPPSDGGVSLPDWDGSDLAGKRILIRKRRRDIGADLRQGRLIELAGRRAAQAVALVERRLVPLFQRSFPSAQILADDTPVDIEAFDVFAWYELLGLHLVPDNEAIRAGFCPLVPAPDRTDTIRSGYERLLPGCPKIGVSWHSANTGKDCPAIEDWARFVSALGLPVFSVNYGDRSADITAMEAGSGLRVFPDPVDQIASLDDLAAQIGALDALVTISNSAAHLAGSMGAGPYVVFTPFANLIWPRDGSDSPWYPGLRMTEKQDGSWEAALLGVAADLRTRFGLPRPA